MDKKALDIPGRRSRQPPILTRPELHFQLDELETITPADSDSEDNEAPARIDRDIVEYQVARSLTIACRYFINNVWARDAHENIDEYALSFMLRSISLRGTSRSDDETICIATFMGVDPTPLLDTLPQDRMTMLLRNLPCIPKSTLFSYGPRQQTPGFRWAPLTFLAPHGVRNRLAFPTTYAAEPKTRVPVPIQFLHQQGLGLAVFFSGIRFAVRPEIPTPENFSVVMPDGTGYLVEFHDSDLDQSWAETSPDNFSGSAAIMFSDPNFDYCSDALLVEMLGQESKEGYAQCKWKCLLWTHDLDQVELFGKKAEMVQKHRFTGEHIPYQWWIID